MTPPSPTTEPIVDLATAARGDAPERLGRKLAHLLAVRDLGIEVPPGYALTTAALDLARRGGDIAWPPELDAPFAEHHARLAAASAAGAFVVRTSATEEDLPAASFAGQYESYLDVRGAAAVRAAVVDCWRSLATPRVDAYRRAHGFTGPARGAVAVMPQLHADLAGLAFSVDPVRGSRGRVALEIGRGTPADVTDGRGRPLQIQVDKHDGRMLAGSDTGLDVDEGEVALVVRHVVALERAFGRAVDVEWGLLRGDGAPRLVVFQVRAVTGLPDGPPAWDMRRYARRYAAGAGGTPPPD